MTGKVPYLAFALALFSLSLGAADWPQWRGPNHDGKSREKGLLKSWSQGEPKKLWSVSGLGDGYSSVAVADNLIFTTGMVDGDCRFFVISPKGKILGYKTYGKAVKGGGYPGPRTTPTIDGNRAYIMTAHGVLICFSVKNGKIIWERDTVEQLGAQNLSWSITESVLIEDDKIICTPGGYNASIAAFDKKGELVWKCAAGSKSAYCSPIAITHNGRRMIITMLEKDVVGVDAKSGKLLWKHPHKNKYSVHPNTPIYYKGKVIVASGYNYGAECLELNDSGTKVKKLWHSRELATQLGGVIRIGDAVVATNDRELLCVDIETGNINWRDKAVGKGSITYADGMLFIYGEKTKKVGLAKVTANNFGGMKGEFTITEGTKQHWAHPVVANGILYIRHGNTLMAFQVGE